ncbi:MAG: selenide, water dikinase [Actinomycetota bacterium]|nr:selenide, water dikinase [Actinomycetota bacterium]
MQTQRRLTSFSHGAGCACKLGPGQLQDVLGGLGTVASPNDLLVGTETGDDAAVYRLNDTQAVVATLDFFTPIVDDPYDWGRIAATNALSDVYAMGGTPLFALNIAAWPVDDLPLSMLGEVLRGGRDVAASAGIVVAGGHSITDPEPKYGMVAIGLVHPDRLTRNTGVLPGASLVLTKPLGLGMISTAIKAGTASPELVGRAIEVMTMLNRDAASAAAETGAAAVTDVTGFGLMGHLHSMLEASGVSAKIDASAVAFVPGSVALARSGVAAGGTRRNLSFVDPYTDWGGLSEPDRLLLADAQTSGGLLIATTNPGELRAALADRGIAGSEIGTAEAGPAGRITVRGSIGG